MTATRPSSDDCVVVGSGTVTQSSCGLASTTSGVPASHGATGRLAATGGWVFIFPAKDHNGRGWRAESAGHCAAVADQMTRFRRLALADLFTGR